MNAKMVAATEGITLTAGMAMAIGSGMLTAIVFLFKAYISSKDKTIADLESAKKSYQEIAREAVDSARKTTDYYRTKYEDKPPILLAAPVIPESASPSTSAQRETAAVATLRASLAQIKLEAGQEPRKEPEHEVESK